MSFGFDAAGRRTTMADGSGTSAWTPDAWGRVTGASQSRNGRSLSYSFNAYGQRSLITFSGTGSARSLAYGYDEKGRLLTVADSAVGSSSPFVYGYEPGTALVSRIETPSRSAVVTSRDALGRVRNTSFVGNAAQFLSGFAYEYNAAGQRVGEVGPRGDVSFGYNGRSELNTAKNIVASVGSGTYSYQYDGIGNRESASGPGFSATYQPNELNQYTEIVEGVATSIPTYDLNGNMAEDGRGAEFVFDEESRLVLWEKGIKRCEYVYDGMSRRVERKEFQNDVLVKTVRYVYEEYLPVEEYEWSGAAIGVPIFVRQITRGTDLSGNLAEAGGVGGLLAFSTGMARTWYFSDANGNIVNLFDESDYAAATYIYDPFGRRLNMTGSLALSNSYQWSSKEYDEVSCLNYYLYRFYDPSWGRWVNRDPVQEKGGEFV